MAPVVEPEVLMDGNHSLKRCCEVTENIIRAVFNEFYDQRVMIEGMMLKTNMIIPGLKCPRQD